MEIGLSTIISSMLNLFNTNPTDLTGLLSFAAATIACLIATWRSGSRDARTWKVLAIMNCLFLIEIFFGSRYRITGLAITLLKAEGIYVQMHGWIQEIIIILIATIGLIFLMLCLFWRQVGGSAARVAASITIAVLTLFAIETVSLHALDVVFYQSIGPVLMIGWVWAIASVGIWMAAICGRKSRGGG
jgi:hypothetical protein